MRTTDGIARAAICCGVSDGAGGSPAYTLGPMSSVATAAACAIDARHPNVIETPYGLPGYQEAKLRRAGASGCVGGKSGREDVSA
jgi:hypothetical protein